MSGCDRCNNGPACENGPWEVWLPAALVALAMVSLKSLAAVEGSLAAN